MKDLKDIYKDITYGINGNIIISWETLKEYCTPVLLANKKLNCNWNDKITKAIFKDSKIDIELYLQKQIKRSLRYNWIKQLYNKFKICLKSL